VEDITIWRNHVDAWQRGIQCTARNAQIKGNKVDIGFAGQEFSPSQQGIYVVLDYENKDMHITRNVMRRQPLLNFTLQNAGIMIVTKKLLPVMQDNNISGWTYPIRIQGT
jgi:hypothetical protein